LELQELAPRMFEQLGRSHIELPEIILN